MRKDDAAHVRDSRNGHPTKKAQIIQVPHNTVCAQDQPVRV